MKIFNLKIKDNVSFHEAVSQAMKLAQHPKFENDYDAVKFFFNSKTCLVSKDTDTKLLFRDFVNSFVMNWETVGPYCVPVYERSVQRELTKRKIMLKWEWYRNQRNQDPLYKMQRKNLKKVLKNTTLAITDKVAFNMFKTLNKDIYGREVLLYADLFGRMVQYRQDLLEETYYHTVVHFSVMRKAFSDLSFLGLTGYQIGAAIALLSKVWIYGDSLGQWWEEHIKETKSALQDALTKVLKKKTDDILATE